MAKSTGLLYEDSRILNKFELSHYIPDDIKKRISLFHVFSDGLGVNMLFKTNGDQMFAIGSNHRLTLGVDHPNAVLTPQLIPELSGQRIQVLFVGSHFAFAVNDTRVVYGWGLNGHCQLACQDRYTLVPQVIESLTELSVIDIKCGSNHCLALTTDHNVYGWGDNRMCQIGDGSPRGEYVIPVKINIEECISIECTFTRSLAITRAYDVYIWGQSPSEYGTLSLINRPTLLRRNIKSASITMFNTYMIDQDNILHCHDSKYKTQDLVEQYHDTVMTNKLASYKNKFDTVILATPSSFIIMGECLAHSKRDDKIYSLNQNKIESTNYNNYSEYLLAKYQITRSTIQINIADDRSYPGQFLFNETPKLSESRFEGQFEIIREIGSGGFGTIYRVRDRFDGRDYCLKKLNTEAYKNQYGGNFMERMKSERAYMHLVNQYNQSSASLRSVVQFYECWTEEMYKRKSFDMYIKMELCDESLSNVLNARYTMFERTRDTPMTVLEYFILAEIFLKLMFCLEITHTSGLIHRDIKLDNFLVKYENDQVWIKIADFGISTRSEQPIIDQDNKNSATHSNNINHTQAVGTFGYRAPEVRRGTQYTNKADIYSLGVIGSQLFDLRGKKTLEIYSGHELLESMEYTITLIGKLKSDDTTRPLTRDIISEYINRRTKFFDKYLESIYKEFTEFKFRCDKRADVLGDKSLFLYQSS